MSYGIILYRLKEGRPIYLMVQRNYTPDFKEIVRGKFDLEDAEYVTRLISRLTLHEINYIETYSHKVLYNDIDKYYKVKRNKLYNDKNKVARDNYMRLMTGYENSKGDMIKFNDIIEALSNNGHVPYSEPDWGFAKGRRNYRGNESNLECAIREVEEETGIRRDFYELRPNYHITEEHMGTNSVNYAHTYYLGRCEQKIKYYIDPNNKSQSSEIRKLGWYTYEDAIEMIRPYHDEKKNVLTEVHEMLLKEL
jgi:8-oxo-dGTP pyrophosphatase MutT (NUDIX family)